MEFMKPNMFGTNTDEQHAIAPAEPAAQAEPQVNAEAASDAVEEVKETAPSQPQAPAQKPAKAADKVHHLTFLGQGVWKDSENKYWCREEKRGRITHKVMSDSELNRRPDIKFMIKYGAIKDVIVE